MIIRFTQFIVATLLLTFSSQIYSATITGELKKWHKVTLLFMNSVRTSESATPNPFLDYSLVVTFTNNSKTYVVNGHYAADGNAAETGATTGNVWRVYFTPDETGIWKYSVSFRTGTNIAVDDNPSAGTPVAPIDGESGFFNIAPSGKTGNDFRAKGMLKYTGGHYLQFAETGEYFLKGGADSPENFLAYWEFDGTFDISSPPHPIELTNGLHRYAPHVTHWRQGNPQWQGGKGKGIIGALNYLASKGMNSVYFITYNIDGGDGKDVWMWTSNTERWRYDVSKLDQWEKVFSHMDSLGIQMHVVTQEVENQNSLGGSTVTGNNMRKLYYRELISRFGHHLGVLWNLGEENSTDNSAKAENAQYIREKDPYDHPITVHTPNNGGLPYYKPLMDNSTWIQYFEVTSCQGDGFQYNPWAIDIRNYSASKGRKWVVCGDEQTPDVSATMSNLYTLRKDALWGNLMGGGAGVEWYFGYQGTFGDLTSEDWTIAAPLWDQTKIALDFFRTQLPFTKMTPSNNLLNATGGGYCLYEPGMMYVAYLKTGGSNSNVSLNLPAGNYNIQWFNPRTGGGLISTNPVFSTGGFVSIGKNPAGDSQDWVVLARMSGVSLTIVQSTLPEFCQGKEVILTAISPVATSYLWSTGDATESISVAASGNYSVTAYDADGDSAATTLGLIYDESKLLSAHTLIGTGEVRLTGNTLFSGGIGVKGNSNKAIIANSVISSPATFVKAKTIIATGSTITKTILSASTVSLPQFENASNPGQTDVAVPANTSVTLSGSAYRDIVVGANAALIFTAPVVNIKTLTTLDNATMRFSSCSKLRVKDKIVLGVNNTFNPDNVEMRIFVSKNVSIGGGTSMNADLYSKNILTVLDGTAADPNIMRGLFIAKTIDARNYTEWQWNESCRCNPGTAKSGIENDVEENTNEGLGLNEDAGTLKVFPNPFKERLTIEFKLEQDSRAKLDVISITGQRLATLFNGEVKASEVNTVAYNAAMSCDCMIICRLVTDHRTYYGKAVMIK